MGIQARRLDTSYAAGAVYMGIFLRQAFDRTEDTLQASFRYKVTTLTTLVVRASADNARFTYSPGRDSNGFRVMPGVEFSAFAILQGSAYVGVRKVNMLGPNIPDYQGPVASVDLGYMLFGRTRFSAQVGRDVYYSYEAVWPYYVQTGITVTATERIAGPFDAQARVGRANLDYPLIGRSDARIGRTDTVRVFGGGVGYRVGSSTRLGLNVDSYRRDSQDSTRQYRGLRIGTSLTYGF